MLIELKNGKRKEFKPAIAKVLIARGVGKEVDSSLQYQTRMMTAEQPSPERARAMVGDPRVGVSVETAPYGYKADGTPRKRPGRPATVSE